MMPWAALFPSISMFQSLVSGLRVSGIVFTQLITHTLYSTHPLYITRWYVLGAMDNQRCLMWHEFCLTVHSSVGRLLDGWLCSEVGSDRCLKKRIEGLPWWWGVKTLSFHFWGHRFDLWSGTKIPHAVHPKKKKKKELITYNWSSDVGRSHSQFEERPRSKGIQSLVLKVGMWFRCSILGRGSYHMSK